MKLIYFSLLQLLFFKKIQTTTLSRSRNHRITATRCLEVIIIFRQKIAPTFDEKNNNIKAKTNKPPTTEVD